MYEDFVREHFGFTPNFDPAGDKNHPLHAIAVIAFEQVIEYRTAWNHADKCMEVLARDAATALSYMRQRGRPYDHLGLPAESIAAVQTELTYKYIATKRILTAYEAMVTA